MNITELRNAIEEILSRHNIRYTQFYVATRAWGYAKDIGVPRDGMIEVHIYGYNSEREDDGKSFRSDDYKILLKMIEATASRKEVSALTI